MILTTRPKDNSSLGTNDEIYNYEVMEAFIVSLSPRNTQK